MWRKLKRAVKDEELSTALTRWDDSYGRTKQEDKLIDYWIVLESLFLPREGQVQEMGETAAMVVAHYIGRDAAERRSIREDIKRAHTVRSHIIHAKRGEPNHDLAEIVTKTGDYLRRALRKRIEE